MDQHYGFLEFIKVLSSIFPFLILRIRNDQIENMLLSPTAIEYGVIFLPTLDT